MVWKKTLQLETITSYGLKRKSLQVETITSYGLKRKSLQVETITKIMVWNGDYYKLKIITKYYLK